MMSRILDLSEQDDYRSIVLTETMIRDFIKPYTDLCTSIASLVVNPDKWPQATQVLQEVPFAAVYAFRCHEVEEEERVGQVDYPRECDRFTKTFPP